MISISNLMRGTKTVYFLFLRPQLSQILQQKGSIKQLYTLEFVKKYPNGSPTSQLQHHALNSITIQK